MRITVVQLDTVWASPQDNFRKAAAAIGQHSGSDVYVLPEMFSTGFAIEPETIDDESSKTSLVWMAEMANKTNAALAGSISFKEEGKFFNRFIFMKPDGHYSHYDKHHLFAYGNENCHYSAGQQRVVTEFRGVRFLLQVCYDLRFPVFARNKKDYDALLYVANWPTSRIEAWRTLMKARAIENQCFVVGVNRVGSDPVCHYGGCSAIINPYGQVMKECGNDAEETVTVELDLQKLNEFREKFPVLNDADPFKLLYV